MRNLTSEFDCPKSLRPGDRVHASIEGRYVTWIVREVEQLTECRQKVVASAPGVGAVRFEWFGGHHRSGRGHGLTFYYLRPAKSGGPSL